MLVRSVKVKGTERGEEFWTCIVVCGRVYNFLGLNLKFLSFFEDFLDFLDFFVCAEKLEISRRIHSFFWFKFELFESRFSAFFVIFWQKWGNFSKSGSKRKSGPLDSD